MNYRTLCRNPNCLKPLKGELPAKLYCNQQCKAEAASYWNDLAANPAIDENDQHELAVQFEEKFIKEFQKHYGSPCFGIETEYGP